MEVFLVLIVGFTFVRILVYMENRKVKKHTKTKTLRPTMLTHVEGLRGYGKGAKVKLSRNSKEITVDGECLVSIRDILSTSIKSSRELVDQHKSVLGRSVAGAVIAGPVGAIIGGVSGTGVKQTTQTVTLLTINYKKFGEKKTVVFSTTGDPHIVGNLEIAF